MGGFFPIYPGGGGGGGQNPANAFIHAELQGNNIVFTRDNGLNPLSIDLSQFIALDSVTDIVLDANGTDLTIIKKDGSAKTVDLTPLLGVREFSYDPTTKVITVIDHNGGQVEVDLSKFAKLDEENIFTEVNVMPDLMLNSIAKTNKHYSTIHDVTSGRWFGIKTQTTEGFYKGFAEHIRVYVENILPGTTELTGFRVWSVKSETDEYIEELQVTQPVKIQGQAPAQYIDIPIQREFNEKVYFVFYLPPAVVNNQFNRYRSLTGVAQYQTEFVNTSDVPVQGGNPPASNQGWCIYAELHGRISVKETLLSAYVDSAYDQVTGELTLIKADGTSDIYQLAVGGGTITDVVYDEGNYQLTVSKNGQPPVTYDLKALLGVQTFNYNTNTRTIEVTDENGQQHIIEHIVTEWKDLEHVSGYDYANYLDYSSRENGKYYEITGTVGQPPTIGSNTAWSLVNVPVKENSDYTILRKANQSPRIVYLDSDGNFVRGEEIQYQYVNGWWRADITIPQGSGIAFIGLSFQHGSTNDSQIMVIEGQVTEALEPIPYLHGYKISIDGDEVGIRFDPTNTNLIGSVVEDLKELDSRVTTINTSTVKTINDQVPDAQGNINWSVEDTADFINFKVETQIVGTLDYATQTEVDAIKNNIIVF